MTSDRRFLLLVAMAAITTTARANPSADLARCAVIAAPESRLACYDALAGRAPDGNSLAKAPVTAAAATPAPAVAKPAPDPVRDFGLTKAQVEKSQPQGAPEGPLEIKAVVTSLGSRAGQILVTLDNGQTWGFSDDDSRLSTGDSVIIRRAALGAFMMITPSHHTHYVRRTR